jgi:hypothetical protein
MLGKLVTMQKATIKFTDTFLNKQHVRTKKKWLTLQFILPEEIINSIDQNDNFKKLNISFTLIKNNAIFLKLFLLLHQHIDMVSNRSNTLKLQLDPAESPNSTDKTRIKNQNKNIFKKQMFQVSYNYVIFFMTFNGFIHNSFYWWHTDFLCSFFCSWYNCKSN